MASSDILSQTLSTITSIKLDEISLQQSNFEDGKASLLRSVSNEADQGEKIRILLSHVEGLASMGKLADHQLLSLSNIKKFLEQAGCDPSVSVKFQKDWQIKIEKELDVHSLRYEYASLYGNLVKEWLSIAEENPDNFEEVGRKEMHTQRETWEGYVFEPRETDTAAIQSHLKMLFKSSKDNLSAYNHLREATENFEESMARDFHFNHHSLKSVLQGLLRSDLITDEKRKILKDFLNNTVVLGELADVLNMRMRSLDKWVWAADGTPMEQRRRLNGRYRFYSDEDLLQSILLRYIGVKWSIHFKNALTNFQNASGVWKASSTPVPTSDKKRRDHFLGGHLSNRLGTHFSGGTVESKRETHFRDDILLEQLQYSMDERRGGYDDDDEEADTRKSSHKLTQELLHILAAEIIMKTRLGEEISVVRSDFKWFGPSLPHSTMFAVLSFFGVSDRWVGFFRRVLEAPMKFVQDGPNAPVRIRKRGTPISGPLSDMLGETVLFCLDFSFNQLTNGARLYRLHDDIWFWGNEKTCVKGWKVMIDFANLMGLDFAEEKTGSVKINRKKALPTAAGLPKGAVRWGFLQLDSATGRFLIDQKVVDEHTEELGRQLGACKSVFDWIQAWNVYGVNFFKTNFGLPANCFGRAHVDSILQTFTQIQAKLFASTGGSVTSTLKQMLTSRFSVTDIPEGYLYFPMSMGGLDLKSPFVSLYLLRDNIAKNPDSYMDIFFYEEEASFRVAKIHFDDDTVPGRNRLTYTAPGDITDKSFMSFEEFTRYRERTSIHLHEAYMRLIAESSEVEVQKTSDVAAVLGACEWDELKPYYRWIMQLYAPDMIARFGSLTVVEKGLLPTGMVGMFRESRFKWQG